MISSTQDEFQAACGDSRAVLAQISRSTTVRTKMHAIREEQIN